MKHKIFLLLAVVASVALTVSCSKNSLQPGYKEKHAMSVVDLRKEISTLMSEARGAISWKRELLKEMNDLVNDLGEAIRKMDCGEITCLNDETKNIKVRIKSLQSSIEDLDLRNGNLVQRVIVLKNFLDKDTQLQKQVLSNALIEEIIGMNRDWNTLEEESKRLATVYGERVEAFQSKTDKQK